MPEDPESRRSVAGPLRQLSLAMELPFVMVAGILVGGGIGYFADRWLHISPALTLTGGALGFAWGMWDILRRLSRERKQGNSRGG